MLSPDVKKEATITMRNYYDRIHTCGTKHDTAALGIKGSNLCEMSKIVPVPDGFIVSSEVCQEYYTLMSRCKRTLPCHAMEQCITAIHDLEERTGTRFGESAVQHNMCPLLLSVRPSTPSIVGGLMDSVLNLGLNDNVLEVLATKMPGGSRRFALDTYKRFLFMFGTAVLKVDKREYECALQRGKDRDGVTRENELSEEGLEWIVQEFKRIAPVPVNPWDQLWMALEGIYKSLYSRECNMFREEFNIEEVEAAAVVIQRMVFGNLNEKSGTGVCFSRLLSVGGNLYGNFLRLAEGDDASLNDYRKASSLTSIGKELYDQLQEEVIALENYYQHNFQFVEFTIQDGALFILETNAVKNNPQFNGRLFVVPLATEDDISSKDIFSLAKDTSVYENPLHCQP